MRKLKKCFEGVGRGEGGRGALSSLFAIKIKMLAEFICRKNLDMPPMFFLIRYFVLFRWQSVVNENALLEPARRFQVELVDFNFTR